MHRSLLIAILAAALLSSASSSPRVAAAPPAPGQVITLKDTLEKGLKVRTDREKRFIARVVSLVENETFEEDLVKSVFAKARRRSGKFPFLYFRFMMQAVAKRQGVPLAF